MAKTEKSPQKRENFSLLWQFLKGAKRYFFVTVLAAGVTALADMLQPQIIRAAVDCALGGKEGNFPAFIMDAVAAAFVPIAQALKSATAAPPRKSATICVWSVLLKKVPTVPVVTNAILMWANGARSAVCAPIV